MKALIHTSIIALLGLAAAGCSSSGNMASSDDMYHSRADRTVVRDDRSASPADYADSGTGTPAQAPSNNPEYSSSTTSQGSSSSAGTSTRNSGSSSDEYYSDNYDYYYASRLRRFHSPAPVAMAYYDPFYTDYYWYNPRAAYYGSIYSGYFYTSPWAYDPFWAPRPYGYGPVVSIGIGYGWGNPYYGAYPYYAGFGNPYWGYGGYGYNPYGMGYAHGYANGFNDGAYGWGGRTVNYGRRGDRSSASGNYYTNQGRGDNSGGRATTAQPASTGGGRTAGGRSANAPTGTATTPATSQPGRAGRDSQNTYQSAPAQSSQPAAAPGRDPRMTTRPETNAPVRSEQANPTVRPNTGYQPAPRQTRGNALETAPNTTPRNLQQAPVQVPGNDNPRIDRGGGSQTQPMPNVTPTPEPRQRGWFRGNRNNNSQAPVINQPAPTRGQPSISAPSRGGSDGGSRSSGGSSGGGGRRGR